MYIIVQITLRSLVFGATIVSLLCKCFNSIFFFLISHRNMAKILPKRVKHETINQSFFLIIIYNLMKSDLIA